MITIPLWVLIALAAGTGGFLILLVNYILREKADIAMEKRMSQYDAYEHMQEMAKINSRREQRGS